MKQAYKEFNFHDSSLRLIFFIDKMVTEYVRQGYTLSVRQIYYQLVARDMVKNTENSYKRVASLINDGRLAGYIDWDAIEDRGRDIEKRSSWERGSDILTSARDSFHMDMWEHQNDRVFVIVEKAALAGVLGGVCRRWDVPLLAARGYPSVSVVRELALQYIKPALTEGQDVTVLHLGDHDPSGIDMTRDLDERLSLFLPAASSCAVQRIALNMDQIRQYDPPPNPAKVTDSRFEEYARNYGDESWELDALEPSVLESLVEKYIKSHITFSKWSARVDQIESIRENIDNLIQRFKDEHE